MEKNIIKAEDLPKEEKIYFKKDFLGWRLVYPIKDENGKIILTNFLFGGKRNLFYLVLIILFILFLVYAYYHDLEYLLKVFEDPCKYCMENFGGLG